MKPATDDAPRRRIPRTANRISLAAEEIFHAPYPEPDEMVFLARNLVQVTLPHSDPGDVPVWGRTNGNLTLTIKPDWTLDPQTNQPTCLGLPYGTIPRLLLFWITTETLRQKSRKITLGDSLSGFMRELDLTPTGGRWGSIPRLKKQMERLFRAKISFEERRTDGELKGTRWLDMPVAPQGELWWNHQQPDQSSLLGSWIELGEAFYDSILAAPVPVDLRALLALKNSPLALDLYAWSTYRTHRVNRSGRKAFIPWRGLAKQFGGDYANVKDFKRKAKQVLRKVQAVYPGLVLEDRDGGFNLCPGRTAVRKSAAETF
ncbi:replication protein RepA [Stratiformator vulcanicus]|uniref:Plasmid encoded RepA protein n=1 Tax=Stratiformator vulcanicus TaxID=2527980 RepID=A0A517R1A5_9PLAN|nr:replication protein RepA [Stratiformator vulcanicus]QDT37677.1 Plasmid encoded RepA protein [Stratiformator vulcanicus]